MLKEIPKAKCLYLIQSSDFIPYPSLKERETIILTWKSPINDSIYYPNSSWNTGRNKLREVATTNLSEFHYIVFLDDDLNISHSKPREDGKSVWDVFEEFLFKWKPAIGYCRYPWHYCDINKEANCTNNIDACFNAINIKAIDVILPYTTEFDEISWWYSQVIIMLLANIFYTKNRIQCNSLIVENTQNRSYPKNNGNFDILYEFLKTILKQEYHELIILVKPDERLNYDPEVNTSYSVSKELIEKYFHIEHPWVKKKFSKWLD